MHQARGYRSDRPRQRQTKAGVSEYPPYAVNVAGLRRRLGLTQEQFAAHFGFFVATRRQLGTRRQNSPWPRPGIAEFYRPGTQGGNAGFSCGKAFIGTPFSPSMPVPCDPAISERVSLIGQGGLYGSTACPSPQDYPTCPVIFYSVT